jgi:hypothetical protein
VAAPCRGGIPREQPIGSFKMRRAQPMA